jgi:putative pyruvate formate lyase activating enzyme
MDPGYIETYRWGGLTLKIEESRRVVSNCHFCERRCGVDRTIDEKGNCLSGVRTSVSSAGPHHGEEACLRGVSGSGTIFFVGCGIGCVFCQNHEISAGNEAGIATGPGELAELMLNLQQLGCHNINFVTPTHAAGAILEALPMAIEGGLKIPLVYNTGGYDTPETLALFDGLVDIYMPDFKFWNPDTAARYLDAPDYPDTIRRNLLIMHRQTGDLVLNDRGVAVRGLLVRHLVMPGLTEETRSICLWIAENISTETAVNVMFQYHPSHRVGSGRFRNIDRHLTMEEMRDAKESAATVGLTRLL